MWQKAVFVVKVVKQAIDSAVILTEKTTEYVVTLIYQRVESKVRHIYQRTECIV